MTGTQKSQQDDEFSPFSTLREDIPAGIAVFLVSVPLSLGIALASGVPLFSGLITGIVGGLAVAPLSGSALGISGAAAGLALIVLPTIEKLGLGGFLLATVIAGLLQILMGLIRAGVIAYYFPSSVVNGMLTGIGTIIFLKQIPHAVGYDTDYEGDFNFIQSDNHSSLTELFHMVGELQPGAILIATLSLVVLLLWEMPFIQQRRFFHLLQAPLVVVALGIISNELLRYAYPEIALTGKHLVMIPVVQDIPSLMQQLHFPDFSQTINPGVYFAALTLAVVASLETLLSVDSRRQFRPLQKDYPNQSGVDGTRSREYMFGLAWWLTFNSSYRTQFY
jgi:carbonic anhydrase